MMYFLLSPAKNLNEQHDVQLEELTQPALLDDAACLMNDVRPLSPQDIATLMHVSDKIARLNVERNQAWQPPFDLNNAKPALYMFNGDVYEGIDAYARSQNEIEYINQNVRILSGLYGLLRPLDLMQAYRLEMGTPLINSRGKNLYDFWGNRITQLLNQSMQETGKSTIINLASQEYFKAVQPKNLNARLITPIFKDEKNGTFKIISFYAKRARGLMVRYAAEHNIQNIEDLKNFDLESYAFDPASSSENKWVFLRSESQKP